MDQVFHVERLFNGESFLDSVTLTISAGKIHSIENGFVGEAPVLKGTVVPGFIDVQVNGGGGAFFNAEQTPACLDKMAKAHGRFGSTGLMPTLITDRVEVMQAAADATAQAIADNVPGVFGIHFEGPHLSLPKKGTHSEQYIRPISEAEFAVYARTDLGIKMVTLAPENVSVADIKRLVSYGVKVCLGHTNADFETTQAALLAGADGFTHLFNAMSAFTSRGGLKAGARVSSKKKCSTE